MIAIFLRHGIAEEAGHDVPGADEKRRLIKQGIKETKWMGDALAALNFKPTIALTSPLQRAVETSEAVLSRFKNPLQSTKVKALAPSGTWTKVQAEIKRHAKPQDTLILVGHQPSLGEHVLRALGATPGNEFDFPKSGCVVLKWKEDNLAEPAELLCALSPASARRIRKLKRRSR